MKGHPLLATEEQLVKLLQVDQACIERWKRRKSFQPVGDYSTRGTKKPLYSVTQAKRERTKDQK